MSKDVANEKHVLKRITIIDKGSTTPLYDKIYNWKPDDQSPSTAVKLMALFGSIATTFKDSDTRARRVIFEQSNEQQRKAKANYNKFSTGLPSLGGRTNAAKATTSASRFMMAQNNQSQNTSDFEVFIQTCDNIVCAIFMKPAFYLNDGYEPMLLRDLGNQFLTQFGEKLRSINDILVANQKDQEAARNNLSLMKNFMSFEPEITDDFITQDVMSPTMYQRKFDIGAHTLPLSSDLISGTGRGASHPSLDADGAVSQIVQPKFFPQFQRQQLSDEMYGDQLVEIQAQIHQRKHEQAASATSPNPVPISPPGGTPTGLVSPTSNSGEQKNILQQQRQQRMALQQGLQPPPSSTATGVAKDGPMKKFGPDGGDLSNPIAEGKNQPVATITSPASSPSTPSSPSMSTKSTQQDQQVQSQQQLQPQPQLQPQSQSQSQSPSKDQIELQSLHPDDLDGLDDLEDD